MAKINFDITKTERDKQMYEIIVSLWKFMKPYTLNLPKNDKEWDGFTEGLRSIAYSYKEHGVPEDIFAIKMASACADYMQAREAESRRAPN